MIAGSLGFRGRVGGGSTYGKRGDSRREKGGQRLILAVAEEGRGVNAEENEQRRSKSSGTDFSPD